MSRILVAHLVTYISTGWRGLKAREGSQRFFVMRHFHFHNRIPSYHFDRKDLPASSALSTLIFRAHYKNREPMFLAQPTERDSGEGVGVVEILSHINRVVLSISR